MAKIKKLEDTRFIVPCRGSYVYVARPKEGKDSYGIQLIVDKDKEMLGQFAKACKIAAVNKFGEKVNMKSLKMPVRMPESEYDEVPEHLEGMVFLNANQKSRAPQLMNQMGTVINRKEFTDEELEEKFYSGAHFAVQFNFYGFDVDGNKGIACGLDAVMFTGHGERLGGGGSSVDGSNFGDFASDDMGEEGSSSDSEWGEDDSEEDDDFFG